MYSDGKIYIGKTADEKDVCLYTRLANRHGLITGATGTGKTTTLKLLAESFSDAGVPVFFSDVKGDLAGMATEYPVTFWDIYGNEGIPVRTTVSEMGPILLAKLMELNETQSDVLQVAFKIADDNGLLIIDTKDLKAVLTHIGENAKEYSSEYGNIARQTVNTIIRNIVALECKGADKFFGEPALNIADWFTTGQGGKGMINMLECKQLVNDGELYSTFLLWMLSELFETLPEVGDLDRPRMVFFFDEAHLVFKNATKALNDKLLQIIKLIRSKGVGVYFISQSPRDIPDDILSQLGNKIQHGMRAYTPAEERAVQTIANSLRANPEFNTFETILNLGTGEAVVSCLDDGGIPQIVEKVKVNAPVTMDLNITEEQIKQMVVSSNAYLRYNNMEDRDSAYEFFLREAKLFEENAAAEAQQAAEEKEALKKKEGTQKAVKKGVKQVASTTAGTIGRELGKGLGGAVGGKFGKTIGGNVGAQLFRSVLGTFLK
ncbi:MAG: DUF853 family protein [Eubacteriales bacterium]|nr:DUF853 family protein [Eubacteriales bacterium]